MRLIGFACFIVAIALKDVTFALIGVALLVTFYVNQHQKNK